MSLDIKMLDLIKEKNPDKIDMVTNTLWYIGFKFSSDSKLSDSKWKIYRFKLVKGDFTINTVSDDPDQIWNDRFTIFEDSPNIRKQNPMSSINVDYMGVQMVKLAPIQLEILENINNELRILNKYMSMSTKTIITEDDLT